MPPSTAPPRSGALLFVLSGNMLLDALEVSTTVVAMPSIGAGLHLTPAAASWTMTGFALGFGGTVLLGARLTATTGRRRAYLAALLVFAAASVVAGLAASGPVLVASRVVKGACVALTAPTGLSIIAATFPEGPRRARALSIYALFGASGFSAGLLLSGALTLLGWRWTLLFSGPVALVLFAFGARLIPADRGGAARRTPPVGPVVSARLLRSAAGAAVVNGSYWGFLLVVTFETQQALGFSSLDTGLALLPTSIPLMVSAGFSGRMVSRFGPGRPILLGSLSALLGYAWYLARPAPVHLADLLCAGLLVGVGFMLSFSALHFQAVAGIPPGRQPAASGLYQTSVQIGGATVLAAVATGTGPVHRPALLVVTAVAAAGLPLAVAGLVADRPKAPEGESCAPIPSRSSSSLEAAGTDVSHQAWRGGSRGS